jgi:uncharacterized membrane protein YccF (DUF307 family)
MRVILNVLWIVTGGIWMALGWLLAALLLAITIVGLPWAAAALRIAGYSLLPFGYRAIPRTELPGGWQSPPGMLLGVIGNVIWFLLAGWWLALGHLLAAFGLACTIIGIPFAWAHLKLAGLAAFPIGKAIVPIGIADARWRTP